MLYRGTTPYHSFALPLSMDDIEDIYITYMQNNEVVFEKTLDDIELTAVDPTDNSFITDENLGDSLSGNNPDASEEVTSNECQATVHLTQEDTLSFKFWPAAEKNVAVIQIRVLDKSGEAYASEPVKERIYGVLKEGVI